MCEKAGGLVTGALFNIARKLQESWAELLGDTRPLALNVGLVGAMGNFVLPEPTESVTANVAGRGRDWSDTGPVDAPRDEKHGL